jgi:hypothetical protein
VAKRTGQTGALIARRRQRAARLSAVAGIITATLALFFGARNHAETYWIVIISVPPIALSLAAAVQYRRTAHTGAGAAAAAVYWAFLLVWFFQAVDLFVIGALLQTAAWLLTRPDAKPREDTSTA